jgi:hypothetical protein
METELRKWSVSTKIYGTLYPLTRLYLIVAAGVVAAGDTLSKSPFPDLTNWVPLLAVSVTIVTALDTWLRPRDKWRGFMRDRDDLATLVIRGNDAERGNGLEGLIESFADLRRRHRDDNVY